MGCLFETRKDHFGFFVTAFSFVLGLFVEDFLAPLLANSTAGSSQSWLSFSISMEESSESLSVSLLKEVYFSTGSSLSTCYPDSQLTRRVILLRSILFNRLHSTPSE